MKVLYDQQTLRGMAGPLELSQVDDAWHPIKSGNYIEWWYFDLMNSDGAIVRGQFYISGNVSRRRAVRTGVRASYVTPDGHEMKLEEKFDLDQFQASTDSCNVQIGKSFIRGDLSRYTVYMEGNGSLLDLEMVSPVPGFKSHACFGDEKHYMYWVVPQPRSHARGVFRAGTEEFKIDGLGYRDHNWLNFPPMNVIACWDWGRVYDSRFTVLFAEIAATRKYENALIKPLVIYGPDGLLYLTSESAKWSLKKSGSRFAAGFQASYPESYRIEARDQGLDLSITLGLEKAFQQIDLLEDFNPVLRLLIKTFRAKPTITSFFSKGPGRLEYSGEVHSLDLTSVHEFLNNT